MGRAPTPPTPPPGAQHYQIWTHFLHISPSSAPPPHTGIGLLSEVPDTAHETRCKMKVDLFLGLVVGLLLVVGAGECTTPQQQRQHTHTHWSSHISGEDQLALQQTQTDTHTAVLLTILVSLPPCSSHHCCNRLTLPSDTHYRHTHYHTHYPAHYTRPKQRWGNLHPLGKNLLPNREWN